MKGSPQRVGIFETKNDTFNFFYDLLIGIRRGHGEKQEKVSK